MTVCASWIRHDKKDLARPYSIWHFPRQCRYLFSSSDSLPIGICGWIRAWGVWRIEMNPFTTRHSAKLLALFLAMIARCSSSSTATSWFSFPVSSCDFVAFRSIVRGLMTQLWQLAVRRGRKHSRGHTGWLESMLLGFYQTDRSNGRVWIDSSVWNGWEVGILHSRVPE